MLEVKDTRIHRRGDKRQSGKQACSPPTRYEVAGIGPRADARRRHSHTPYNCPYAAISSGRHYSF